MLWYSPGDSLRKEFVTSHPANGQAVDADSLPVAVLLRNGTIDDAVDVTVTLDTDFDGAYTATCTIPSGYAAGDTISIRVAATVAGVAGRMVLFETRLILLDLKTAIAAQLFVDGSTNKLKVNTDHSVTAQMTLTDQDKQDIADGINGYTAAQIAAGLVGTHSVNLLGPLMTGELHRLVRGSAYLRAHSTAPFQRVAKTIYPLSGATAEFRVKIDGNDAVVFSAVIESYNSDYWEIYCELSSDDTASVAVGSGADQFWVIMPSGQEIAIDQRTLEVIPGIGVG